MSPKEKDRLWRLRVSGRNDALVREAARLTGQPMSAFVEKSAVARAGSVIADNQPWTLGCDSFSRFVGLLDDAPVAVPALIELFSRETRIPSAE